MDISLLLSAAKAVPETVMDHHARMTTSPTSVQQFVRADDILHSQIEAAAHKLRHDIPAQPASAPAPQSVQHPSLTLPSPHTVLQSNQHQFPASAPVSMGSTTGPLKTAMTPPEIGADGKIKRFECDVPGCNSKFGQKGSLTRHMKSRHEKRRPHACTLCKKSFSEKWTLNVHLRNVHEKRKPHKCNLCKKSFGERWNLRKHINVVHKNIKPYSCDICSRAFGYKGDMRKHVMELHVQEGRPFQCTVASCGVKFARLRYLRRHQNLTHRPSSTTTATTNAAVSTAPVSTAGDSAATSLASLPNTPSISRGSSIDEGAYTALQTLSMYASSVREAQGR